MKSWLVFIAFLILVAIGGWFLFFYKMPTAGVTVDFSTNKNYVAMGDSVAAGQGAGNVANDTCGTTDGAYANTVASTLHLSMTNIACGGASLPQGILGLQPIDTDSQIDKLYQLPTPAIITLTIGANDAQWIQVLTNCLHQTCDQPAAKATFDADTAMISTNLKTFYDSLEDHYGDTVPHVFTTGYYDVFPTGVSALAVREAGLSAADVTWLESLRQELNTTIQNAGANYSFVMYVPIDFSNHKLFTSDSWIQNLQAPAPLHPTADGQKAIGQAIVAAIQQ